MLPGETYRFHSRETQQRPSYPCVHGCNTASDRTRAHHKVPSARHCEGCSSCPECITSFESKIVGHSPEKLTGILQKCQDHERKENSEELSETKEKKQLNPNENLRKILVQKKKKKTENWRFD